MAKVKIADVINQRIDSFDFYACGYGEIARKLKDYFSDIDEELATIRKRDKEYKENQRCWYCGAETLVSYGLPFWKQCAACGATVCTKPSGKVTRTRRRIKC